jgi:hypothetical protein
MVKAEKKRMKIQFKCDPHSLIQWLIRKNPTEYGVSSKKIDKEKRNSRHRKARGFDTSKAYQE